MAKGVVTKSQISSSATWFSTISRRPSLECSTIIAYRFLSSCLSTHSCAPTPPFLQPTSSLASASHSLPCLLKERLSSYNSSSPPSSCKPSPILSQSTSVRAHPYNSNTITEHHKSIVEIPFKEGSINYSCHLLSYAAPSLT